MRDGHCTMKPEMEMLLGTWGLNKSHKFNKVHFLPCAYIFQLFLAIDVPSFSAKRSIHFSESSMIHFIFDVYLVCTLSSVSTSSIYTKAEGNIMIAVSERKKQAQRYNRSCLKPRARSSKNQNVKPHLPFQMPRLLLHFSVVSLGLACLRGCVKPTGIRLA